MGRYVKNKEITSGSYSVRMPYGSSAVGPNYPVDGLMRFNQNILEMEYYSDEKWKMILSTDKPIKEVAKDTFYGDGINKVFGPMRYDYEFGDEIFLLVFIGNVFQNPGVAYIVEGNIITFATVPPNGQLIVILHGLAR